MKKLVLFIGIVLVLGGGYVFYTYYYTEKNKDIWSFVPESALMIYETSDAEESYSQIKKTDWGRGIGADFWKGISGGILDYDTSTYDDKIGWSLKNTQILISIHVVAKEELDAVYYVNISKKNTVKILQQYTDKFIANTSSTLTTRAFDSRLVFEIANSELQFSYFMEDGVLAISRTPFLIEDIIRTIDSKGKQTFKKAHQKSLKANKLKNDQGDFYINTAKLDMFFGIFGKDLVLDELGHSTFLDVKITDHLLSLSGFTYVQSNDFLTTMQGQNAVKISVNNYVPNSAYAVFHTGISDADSWYENYQKKLNFESLRDIWDMQRMIGWMGEELALVKVNNQRDDLEGKILFISTKDAGDALGQMDILSKNASAMLQDKVYSEKYGEIMIKELTIPEFPKKLLGEMYKGFSVSYYAIVNGYLVLTSDIESMRLLVNSIEEENTWGRTLAKSQWLSHSLGEANVSYFFDYSQANALEDVLNDRWKSWLQDHDQMMKGVGMGAIQFSNIDEKFYTNIVVEYDSRETKTQPLNFAIESATDLPHQAITKPFVVRNHITQQFREVVVQDSSKNIYLIDAKGAILWQDSIGRSIDGRLYQIDYYKNKKLQYLFAAGQFMYLIDRNGDAVKGYPIDVGFAIDQLSVFDYDHTKDYRILAADKKGTLLMYDKQGNKIEGWNPDSPKKPLLTAPRHIRVRGRDAIVLVFADGEISVLNRRGEVFKGFPIDVENKISGDVSIRLGRDFEHTLFSTITKEGELLQFDLNGKTVHKRQFYRPTKNTFFELVEGVMKTNFVIVRQNTSQFSLLDAKENTIIEKEYFTTNLRNLQYYDLRGNNIYVVNDFTQGFGYVYNSEGGLLNNVPINNDHEIGLLKNSKMNKILIYSIYQNRVRVYSY